MPVFGSYRSIKEVEWGEDSTIFAATSEKSKSAGQFALKVRRFPDAELNAAAFEAANVQKSASEAGCKQFAPVFEIGISDEGCAWYATQLFDSSLLVFLKARNAISPALLFRITEDILTGLAELRIKRQRAHGNLKPANILIEGTDPRTLRVKLTDPSPLPDEQTTTDDLFELGRIIYQLVRRTLRAPILNPPLEKTPEWDEFGDRWLDFCNRLLNRQANEAPEAFEALRAHLHKLRSSSAGGESARKGGRWVPMTIAGVLLLAAAGWGARAVIGKMSDSKTGVTTDRAKYSDATRRAVLALCQAPPATLTQDVYLRENVFAKLSGAPPDDQLVDTLISSVSADQWPAKRTVEEGWQVFGNRQWTTLRESLRKPRADLNVEQPLAPQLAETLETANQVDAIGAEWQLVERIFDEWTTQNKRDLLVLQNWANAKMRSERDLKNAANKIPQIRAELEVASRRVAEDEGTGRFRRERFLAESGVAEKQFSPIEWLAAVDVFQRHENGQERDGWQKKVGGLKSAKDTLPADARRSFEADVQEIERRLADPVKGDTSPINALLAKLSQTVAQAKMPVTLTPQTTPPITTTMTGATPAPIVPATPPPNAKDIALTVWLRGLLTDSGVGSTAKTVLQQWDRKMASLGAFGQQGDVTDLEKQLRTLLQPKPPPPPALSGAWRLESAGPPGANPHYIFQHTAAGFRMPFVLIQPANGPPFYMAGVEVPYALAQASGQLPAKNAQQTGPQFWPPNAAPWLWKQPTIGLVQKIVGPQATFYARECAPAPFSAATPVNGMTGLQAVRMAEALQCTLPSPEQWQAARSYASKSAPRLRGTLWMKQLDHWRNLRTRFINGGGGDPGGQIPWPDDGSYTADSKSWNAGGTPAIETAVDDSSLWFRAVPNGGGNAPGQIHDLIGNVAEFVVDGARRFSVVGGSAISDPTVRDQPQEVRAPNGVNAFSDVGVRLVAPAGAAAREDELLAFRQRVQQEIARLDQRSATPQ